MTVAVQTVFEKAGIDSTKVQLLELPFSAMIDALKAKQIDAVAELDPWTTQLKITNVGRNLSWVYVESVPSSRSVRGSPTAPLSRTSAMWRSGM